MRKILWILLVAFLFGVFLQTNSTALNLSYADIHYLGYINDGIPSGDTAETGYVNNLITVPVGIGPIQNGTEYYIRSSNTFGPLPIAEYAFRDETPSTFNFPTDYNNNGFVYILSKYGDVGSYVWYINLGNLGGNESIVLPQNSFYPNANPNGKTPYPGISHISIYNTPNTSVPEPATMLLLGSGLIGLACFGRRKFIK